MTAYVAAAEPEPQKDEQAAPEVLQRHDESVEATGLWALLPNGWLCLCKMPGKSRRRSSWLIGITGVRVIDRASLLESFVGAALVAEDGSPSALPMRDLLVGGRSIRTSMKCSDQGMYM